MKTESEIRKHITNLKVCQNLPCDCAKTGHERECVSGRLMMEAVIQNLRWVLGEEPDLDRQVECIDYEAKRFMGEQ
jgi:hypothetical protein